MLYIICFKLHSHWHFVSGFLGCQAEVDQCIHNYVEMSKICRPLSFFRPGSDELFVGRAGYLCGSLLLNKKLGKTVIPAEITRPVFDAIIESGQQYSQSHRSASPLMYSYYRTEYLGVFHVSGCEVLLTQLYDLNKLAHIPFTAKT